MLPRTRANWLPPWSRSRCDVLPEQMERCFPPFSPSVSKPGNYRSAGTHKMGFAKRVFRRLPMAVKSPAVTTMKLLQKQTAVGKFYAQAAAMNVVELTVRGDYGVFTQSVADRT